ncbi:uncharacterized protein LOC135974676 [Chrysemys picta bellii]|uniref:uncharacterized protein LOC135974676 n=1 Tax=Chrysemys picta bellii TaxID=8478 RepID=UPI0032B13E3B
MWEEKAKPQSSSLARGLCESPRKPPGVQGSCRRAIPSQGAELMLTSGDGECEMRVCDTDGEPQCHVAEPTGDVCLARLRARPQLLSMETLQGAQDGLERCGELGEELGSCLDLALERFCREPRCVQENARLLIRWDGGELEFISGQGQCEILVLHTELRPQYHITELGGDRPVTWSHTSPEPLSVADLARVRDRLGRWGALGEELSVCFGEAISQFSREPPCMQRNARMGIQWDRGSLEFLSGDGECEISVRYRDGRPQYDIGKLPMRMYLARLRAHPEPLSADTLWSVRDKLGSCMGDRDDLRACFHCAWQGFRQEPRCVQENARLLIRWSGEELEFTSGKGECEITVRYEDGKPQYRVVKIPVPVYLARLHTCRESLSADTLRRVLSELGSCHGDTDALRACFLCAWQGFREEPRCVQGNARLLIRWDGGNLQFLSGEGQCEISVYCRDGTPQYEVGELPMHMYLARLRARPEPVSVDTLWRVRDKLGSCMGDRDDLRACFHCAWQGFCQEPRCVQENARLLIRWGGEELEFVSGQGQCEISVLLADGRPQYHITELGGDRPVTWSHASSEPLSVADLARVRDRMWRWGGLGEELSGCFGEAISQFSQEPPWVQGNARMRIRWDGGSLQFLSGEGQCEISVSYRDRKAQYRVVKIPVHVYLAQLRARRLSLSADTLRSVLSELGSCHRDTDALRTCFDRAWQGFCQEPRCVLENARLLIRWDGQELEFVSGWGENLITVCEGEEGRIQYTVQVSGGWPWIARLLMNYKVSGRD